MRRVREQYRRAIRVHRAQQRRFWRQKWIARIVSAWRAMVGLFAQVTSTASAAVNAVTLWYTAYRCSVSAPAVALHRGVYTCSCDLPSAALPS